MTCLRLAHPTLEEFPLSEQVPLLIITGPVGVGKTTVAGEVSEQLAAAGVAHAFVDIDSLRWCYPRPADDRFRIQLAMRNLASLWPNFRAAGATHLVAADVIESRAELRRFETAIPQALITVVRLRASVEVLWQRVAQRELGSGRDWHLRRAAELAAQMERDAVEDLLVETDGRAIAEIAGEIVLHTSWISSPPD
jgi:adenylylsulfate kinase-like enzyme